MDDLGQARVIDEIIVNVEDLTDETIEQMRAGNRNIMVTIGVLGNAVALLNPTSAAEALARYEKIEGEAAPGDYTACVVGFDDALRTYQISAL